MHVLAPIGYPSLPSAAELRQWSVLEVEDDDGSQVRLLAGLLDGSATKVRLTSQIEQVEGGQVLTRSGSVYTLAGPPATAEQARSQASRRNALLAGRLAQDVTHEYLR
ncbi:hypothetical protein [Mitsuaria sp. GD03876]|uniref:hypothetical protein n=1 Tax=Mitsuaria sp. GD03876 TaxID=2975399 RepID=UPI0024488385|nr:hypothetical protein [Mitsuaria sp. GD03876]MDH0865617.1 hypothetical protein [Mitsuaria sp. GD03876]